MILGYSYMFWAARYVSKSAWGSNLGLGVRAQIVWKGIRGMQWSQFCRAATFGVQPPDVLLIHLGDNNLARHGGKALILDVIRDLRWLRATYPTLSIIWSMVITWLVWQDEHQVQ